RGWAQQAPVKTMSRIDNPGSFGQIGPQDPLTGVAWAQTRGIQRVEVRVDQGDWQVAELSAEVNPDTWRMWRLPVPAAPGGAGAAPRRGPGDRQDRLGPARRPGLPGSGRRHRMAHRAVHCPIGTAAEQARMYPVRDLPTANRPPRGTE